MEHSDTTREAAAVQTAIHRRLGEQGRARIALEMSRLVATWARAGGRDRAEAGWPADAGSGERARLGGGVNVGDPFARTLAALEAAGIPHMLTGSFASSLHGEPRSTQGIDIVIAPTREQLSVLLRHLPEADYHVSRDAAFDALLHHGQFSVIDHATGWKIDFIMRKPRAFSREEFARRRPAELSGVVLDVATAEDVLIAKLEWAKLGGSARQIEDAAGIIRLQGENLDTGYVQRWVDALRLGEQWSAARSMAE